MLGNWLRAKIVNHLCQVPFPVSSSLRVSVKGLEVFTSLATVPPVLRSELLQDLYPRQVLGVEHGLYICFDSVSTRLFVPRDPPVGDVRIHASDGGWGGAQVLVDRSCSFFVFCRVPPVNHPAI